MTSTAIKRKQIKGMGLPDSERFLKWAKDGNVELLSSGAYIEQTTQWKQPFTLVQLVEFFIREFEVES